MLSRFRTIFTAVVTLGVLISTVAFAPAKARACPVRIPSTLLSLYLTSDLIVVADVENETEAKRYSENKHGYYASFDRSLRINKILKGHTENELVKYTNYEYKSKAAPTNKRNFLRTISYRGYGGGVPVKLGHQYLFFLRKNAKKGFTLSDSMSSVKKTDEKLSFYEEKIEELAEIVNNPNTQVENLTEWIVKGIEEPLTRWGSIQDLYNSSNSYENEKRNPKNKPAALKLGKNFRTYNSAIARSLTTSQKARISAVLNDETREAWYGDKIVRPDYRLIRIVSNWDKVGLATNAFTILQGFDDSNRAKKKMIMEFIANIANDQKLRSSYYQYSRIGDGRTPQIDAKNKTLRAAKLSEFNNRFQQLLTRNFEPLAKK